MALSPPFSVEHRADPFGDWPQWRKDMGLGPHRGLDWNGLPKGTPIPASADGVVAWRTNLADPETTELGHRIVVYYPDARVFIGYCHLHANPTLAVGAQVKRGQTVGLLGNSGTASTGAHLHMTASWTSGNPGTVAVIDPAPFLNSAPAPAGGGSYNPLGSDDDMAFILKREDNGKTFLHAGDIITHIVHDDVVRVLNYTGIKGGFNINLISRDDHRRVSEAFGFNFGTVEALPAGQGVDRRTGASFHAGDIKW